MCYTSLEHENARVLLTKCISLLNVISGGVSTYGLGIFIGMKWDICDEFAVLHSRMPSASLSTYNYIKLYCYKQ